MTSDSPRSYVSKAVRLAEQIRSEIEDGKYPIGSMMPTEMQLVDAYAVSRVTIRRSLSILIDEGVLLKMPHRGVMVQGLHAADRGERQVQVLGSQMSIAAILSSNPDEGLSRIQQGIETFARDNGMSFQLLANDASEGGDVFAVLEHVEDLGIDGVIILPYPGDPHLGVLHALQERKFPVVCVEKRTRDIKLPSVEPDNKTGMYRACQLLISRYRRPVFYIGMQSDHKNDTDRYDGYVRAMNDFGYDAEVKTHSIVHEMSSSDPAYWSIERPWQQGFELADRIFNNFERPYSIACLNDYMAWGVYRAAEERGLEIGEDVCVIGFDDLEIASMLTPKMTTVRQHLEEKGYQAARLLRQYIVGDLKVPMQISMPVELVERGSA